MSQSSLEAGDSDEVSSTSIGVEDCWEDRGLVWKAVRDDFLVGLVVVGLVSFLWGFDSDSRFSEERSCGTGERLFGQNQKIEHVQKRVGLFGLQWF